MKEGISRTGQLQGDSVLLHTKHKRENLIRIRNLTKVTSKPRNVKGTNCVIFVQCASSDERRNRCSKLFTGLIIAMPVHNQSNIYVVINFK